jgi:hypothetical protein
VGFAYNLFMNETELIAVTLPAAAMEELREAKEILEHQGLAERLTDLIGAPITASLKLLPDAAERIIYSAVDKSLEKALDLAVTSLGSHDNIARKPRLMSHKILAGLSGAAGGALGGLSVAAELPLSTLLILRSVADIARSQGEDLTQLEARLACLEVLALDPGAQARAGGVPAITGEKGEETDDTEIGYFAVRLAMGKQIGDAAKYVAQYGLADHAAPPLVKLLATVSQRFGVVVSEKLAAQAIPVIGAVGGALINTYFIGHFQDIARAHFTIRRLEREYSAAAVREAWGRVGA